MKRGLILLFVFFAVLSQSVLALRIDGDFEKFNRNDVVKVLVEMEDNGMQNGVLNEFLEKKISQRGNRILMELSIDEIRRLAVNPNVLGIEEVIPLKVTMQDVVNVIGANDSWILKIGEDNLTGSGNSVCILDSGIDRDHPDFGGKILAEKCYCSISDYGSGGCCPDNTNEDNSATDDNGHGTHVAGIVAANSGMEGSAKGANLVIVKIMDNEGNGLSSDLNEGIQWCVDNAATYNISVITASLGADTKYSSNCDNALLSTTTQINSAYSKNISVTIASGNDDWTDGISWPSCISNAIPVGGTDKSDNLDFNRGSILKLLGIGVGVNSTCLEGNIGYLNGYCSKSGTSMATPVVAGAIAIINQVLNLTGQTKTPGEIETILYDNGEIVSEGANNYSRINLYSTILDLDNIAPSVNLLEGDSINLDIDRNFSCNFSDWQLKNATIKIWNSTGLYYNETMNISGKNNESNFSVNNLGYENYEWNCFAYDNKGNLGFNLSNASFTVGGVLSSLVAPDNNSYFNTNITNFSCNLDSDSRYELTNVSFYLWNSTNLLWNETKNISGTSNSTDFNFSFYNLSEGDYKWNCEAVNNQSNSSLSSFNYSINYDISDPEISNLEVNAESSSATIIWNTNEYSNSSTNLGGNSSNWEINHSISLTGLTAGQSYSITVISCDRAGNCVNDSINFTTTSVVVDDDNDGGGGGSSGGSEAPIIKVANPVSELNIGASINKKLGIGQGFLFSVNGENHSINVINISFDRATIVIKSDPIQIEILKGNEEKINLNTDDFYELSIKIIDIADGKINLTVSRINEKIIISDKEDIVFSGTEHVPEEVSRLAWAKIFWGCLIVYILVVLFFVSLLAHKIIKGKKSNKKNENKKT